MQGIGLPGVGGQRLGLGRSADDGGNVGEAAALLATSEFMDMKEWPVPLRTSDRNPVTGEVNREGDALAGLTKPGDVGADVGVGGTEEGN